MSNSPKKLGAIPFVVGGMSFIPFIGFLIGIIVVVWGLFTKRAGGKKLALVGALGMCVTIGMISVTYFVDHSGTHQKLRRELAQTSLNSLIAFIEMHKVQHGAYPETAEALQNALPKDAWFSVFDPLDWAADFSARYFFYERVGADRYYLRSLGMDGLPFTSDDIVPQIDPATAGSLGLIVDGPVPPLRDPAQK